MGVLILAGSATVPPVERVFVDITEPPYNAAGDGVTNDADNFLAFAVWAVEQTVPLELYVPPGTYNVGSYPTGLFSVSADPTGPWKVPRDMLISAAGATFNAPIQILGAQCIRLDGYPVDTVTAGAFTVHLTTPGAAAAHFVTDINGEPLTWAAMTALDLQAPSLPTNTHYFEYLEIESVDTVANTVTFKTALTRSYKSTYPLINWYSTFHDGPAWLYPMDPRFDGTFVIEGEPGNMAVFTRGTQCYCNARDVTLRYCNFTGEGPALGTCRSVLIEDSIIGTGQSEWDKILTNLTLRRCTGHYTTFQSSSIYNVDIDDLTLSSHFSGTPHNLIMNDVSINGDLRIGSGYGWCNSVEISNSSFLNLDFLRATHLITDFLSSAGGVLVKPLNDGTLDRPISWAVEGARVYVHQSNEIVVAYYGIVTDIRENGANIEIVTDAVGTIPVITGAYPSTRIGTIGCGSFSVSNSTGCVQALEWSLAPEGLKPGEYYNRTHTGSVRTPVTGMVWGRLVSMTVTVSQAYTGVAGTCLLNVGAPSGAGIIRGGTNAGWDPKINLKIAGVRTFTPAGGLVGGQTGDIFPTLFTTDWLVQLTPYFATDITAEAAAVRPIVTVEAIFDNGP